MKIIGALAGVFTLYLGVAFFHSSIKPLPPGLSVAGETHRVPDRDVEFLYDVTYGDGDRRVCEQMIYDHVLRLIRGAEDLVVVDFFLFNDYLGRDRDVHRKLSSEITAALLERKRSRPSIRIVVITDPVNEAYGGSVLAQFTSLREAGIPVVATKLEKLRDSNAAYSAFWRMFIQWFGASPGGGLPHPFAKDAGGVGLGSWAALLNFKANHRKVIVADAPSTGGGREMVAMVMSANPHDGSSAHNNIALKIRGGPWRDLLRSEQAVLDFSAPGIDVASFAPAGAQGDDVDAAANDPGREVTVQLLTEEKIRRELLRRIGATRRGDAVDLAMFYLAERGVIKALEKAAARGVSIRVLLDPNRDAFGYEKNGIPNRPVAAELMKRGRGRIAVRWYDTHGEQFHTKMVLLRSGGRAVLFVGSANLTRRNIRDFNLETDVVVAGDTAAFALASAAKYFERLWSNDGHEFTVPFAAYEEKSWWNRWQYRFQESTGFGTF